VEILATYDADRPVVERLADDSVRLVIHFGHTSVDFIDFCSDELSIQELAELIDLWSNPACKRTYSELPGGLLISKA
jgi:hypothetical protein